MIIYYIPQNIYIIIKTSITWAVKLNLKALLDGDEDLERNVFEYYNPYLYLKEPKFILLIEWGNMTLQIKYLFRSLLDRSTADTKKMVEFKPVKQYWQYMFETLDIMLNFRSAVDRENNKWKQWILDESTYQFIDFYWDFVLSKVNISFLIL